MLPLVRLIELTSVGLVWSEVFQACASVAHDRIGYRIGVHGHIVVGRTVVRTAVDVGVSLDDAGAVNVGRDAAAVLGSHAVWGG